MKNLWLAILSLLAVSPATEAALVYALVDHPDLQDGYRLSGTITVSDSAPDDGLLETEEVLDWSWTAEGPWVVRGRFRSTPIVNRPPTEVFGIEIDSEGIRLGAVGTSRLSLEEITSANRRGMTGADLFWWKINPQDQRYGLISYGGDAGLENWGASVPSVGSQSHGFVIARKVPEANAYFLTLSVLLQDIAIASCRSRRRLGM